MLDYRENPLTGVVEIVIDGPISREDFRRVAENLEDAMRRHGKLRVLEELRAFGGMDLATWADDIRFGFKHLNDFSRAAVVTDKAWVQPLAKLAGALSPAEVRVFPLDDKQAARAWLAEGLEAAGDGSGEVPA